MISPPLPFINRSSSDEDFRRLVERLNNKIKEVEEESRFTEKVDIGRVNKLRFSSLPYCPVKWFINLPKSLSSIREKRVNFGYKFYTSVGHTVHDVFQTAMHSYEGVTMLDDYVCVACKHRVPLRGREVKKCPECSSLTMRRDEHEITWKKAEGHIDNILQVAVKDNVRYVFLLDYKTTSLANINKEDPPGYLAQLSSYAAGVDEYENMEVLGYGLVYVPRDNPFKFRLSPYRFDDAAKAQASKRFDQWSKWFQTASSVDTLDKALALLDIRPCKSKPRFMYSECEHASRCAACGDRPDHMVFLVESTFKKLKHLLPVKKIEI